jgi:hypothetical protein
MGRTCGMNGEKEKCVHKFGGKIKRKRPLERPRSRWRLLNFILKIGYECKAGNYVTQNSITKSFMLCIPHQILFG